MFSWRLELHESLASTQDEAIIRARRGEAAGLAVLARRQTKGRGQFNRQWLAPEGNLNLSLLLHPLGAICLAPQWSLAMGVAVAEALPAPVKLKYPNDLMLNGAKLGGILIEAEAEGANIAWLVAGVGINIASAPQLVEQETVALGLELRPEDLAQEIMARVADWQHRIEKSGFAAVRQAWQAIALDPEAAQAHLEVWENH